jgi:hypothetical protein
MDRNWIDPSFYLCPLLFGQGCARRIFFLSGQGVLTLLQSLTIILASTSSLWAENNRGSKSVGIMLIKLVASIISFNYMFTFRKMICGERLSSSTHFFRVLMKK